MEINLFQCTKESPYHLSVGAVLFNPTDKRIACHHFEDFEGEKDIHILMRETVEPGEAIEAAVHRGLMEEFGAIGKISRFLGPIVGKWRHGGHKDGNEIYKTTLYFLVELLEQDVNRRKKDDPEFGSVIEWHEAEFFINKMKK